MRGTQLGEFEEIVLLAIAVLGDKAYGIAVKDELRKRLGRNPSIGALHASLRRLEEKGFVDWTEADAAPERGGRRRRYYRISKSGLRAMQRVKDLRNEMWNDISILPGLKRA